MPHLGGLFKQHPWHGIPIGKNSPEVLTAYIEIVPTDTIKYELDKYSGYLKVDRPQRFSNIVPALYGLVPQTLCDEKVAELCNRKNNRNDIIGDNDPLDICVLTEKSISHGDIILEAIPIGGFRMIDGKEADDKIIAVLKGDQIYGKYKDLSDCPEEIVERLRHYFLTYKELPCYDRPCQEPTRCQITDTYGREEAFEVIRRSQEDYNKKFAKVKELCQMIFEKNGNGA